MTDRMRAALAALAVIASIGACGSLIHADARAASAASDAGQRLQPIRVVHRILYTASSRGEPRVAPTSAPRGSLAFSTQILAASDSAQTHADRSSQAQTFEHEAQTLSDGTAIVPFELLDGLILIRGLAIGADVDTVGDFVLDTGAGFLALDHPLAEWIGITDPGAKPEAVELAPRPLKRFVLGDQNLDLVQPVLTIDGAIIRRVTDRAVLGLLGARLYDDRALQLDYIERRVRLVPARDTAAAGAAGLPADAASAVARSRRVLGRALGAGALGVPFALAGDGKILLRARLGVSRFASSKPMTLILDTGATKTVLFRDALASLGVDHERWPSLCGLSVPTLFGAPSACLVRMPRLNIEAFSGPEEDHERELAQEGDARGGEAIKEQATAPPSNAAPAAKAEPAPARRLRPAVRAMLGDKAGSAPDAGAGKEPPAAAADPDAGGAAALAPASVAGTSPATERPALREATLKTDDLDAIVMDSDLQQVLSRVAETPVHGLLGYTFLRHYKVTLDYPQRVAWFEPAADPDPRPFEYSHPGIQLERDGSALRVIAVAHGSPAAKARIVVGDTLVSVDGRAVAGQELAQVARWLEGEPGTRVSLVVGTAEGSRTVNLTRRRLL